MLVQCEQQAGVSVDIYGAAEVTEEQAEKWMEFPGQGTLQASW